MAEPTGVVVVAVVIGVMTVVTLGASLTGNGKALCDRMGGVYTPQPPPADSCPGGSWLNLFKTLPKPTPT